ncbi:hypothetical protein NX059_009434 [Plenodomus lindquistii]|nr:hypothetical protein NX059_009434 [Plenodomus lindquistii]
MQKPYKNAFPLSSLLALALALALAAVACACLAYCIWQQHLRISPASDKVLPPSSIISVNPIRTSLSLDDQPPGTGTGTVMTFAPCDPPSKPSQAPDPRSTDCNVSMSCVARTITRIINIANELLAGSLDHA